MIDSVVYDAYGGQPGDTIAIRAIDDFKVAPVKLIIMNANGVLLDKTWVYTATMVNHMWKIPRSS